MFFWRRISRSILVNFVKIFFDGTDKDELQSILDELKDEYSARNLQITEVAEGYQLCTRHEYNDFYSQVSEA